MTLAQISPDLPRTMARIRRLVRDNPNDRELQRLLHTLLTSMSAERIDEAAIRSVLSQMERAHSTKPSGNSPPPQLPDAQWIPHGLRASLASPPTASFTPSKSDPAAGAAAALYTPTGAARAAIDATMRATMAETLASARLSAAASSPLPAAANATPTAGACGASCCASPPSSAGGAKPSSGGGAPVDARDVQLEAMRRRHEQALSAMRQKAFRDGRQAQAHHEYATAQLQRQADAQLEAANEAKRAETRRADALAVHLAEMAARLKGLEAGVGPRAAQEAERAERAAMADEMAARNRQRTSTATPQQREMCRC
jgi:hypothetical protein